MTKTNWTADPAFDAWVKTLPEKHWAKYDLSACRLGWEAKKAKRIAADDMAVPVGRFGAMRLTPKGTREFYGNLTEGSIAPERGSPLFTHPPAQPAQEQSGWKVPERLSGGLATLMPEVLVALRRDGYHYSLTKDIELLLAISTTPPKEAS